MTDSDLPPLIGLCGYATSGKDAAAAGLAPLGYRRLSFADNLRSLAYATNPLIHQQHATNPTYLAPVVDSQGWEKAKENPAVRRILQSLGVSCRDTFGEDCWVDALHRQRKEGEQYVITDVRFPNEADYIKSRGGTIIRIDRPGVGPINDHPSEVALNDYRADFFVVNDGTLPELHAKVQACLTQQ